MRTLTYLFAFLCFAAIGCDSKQSAKTENTSGATICATPEALVAAYTDAVKAKDETALVNLTLWKGDVYMRDMQMNMAKAGIESDLVSASVSEVPDDRKQSFVDGHQRDGKTIVPNLPVSKILTIKNHDGVSIDHPIGFDGKRWWITAAIAK